MTAAITAGMTAGLDMPLGKLLKNYNCLSVCQKDRNTEESLRTWILILHRCLTLSLIEATIIKVCSCSITFKAAQPRDK